MNVQNDQFCCLFCLIVSFVRVVAKVGFSIEEVTFCKVAKGYHSVSNSFLFLTLPGEMIQFDTYFSDGLVQPPTSHRFFGMESWAST